MSADKPAETPAAAPVDQDSDDESMAGSEKDTSGQTVKETVHVLKQNKTTGIKSSYYHFSSTPAEEAERYKPQLIADPNQMPSTSPPPQLLATGAGNIAAPPSAATVAAAAPQAVGGSRWNAAGTWEDKDISQWAHARFKELITKLEIPAVGAKITGCEKVSGDCTIIFSRGKRRHGYDIACIANFTAKLAEGATVKGTLEMPEIADSVADEPWQVLISIKDPTAETKKQGEVVYDAWKAKVPEIRKVIDQWVAELKEQQ